jgi:AcrR family transcriptional regulator
MAIRFPASDSAITVDLSSMIVYQLVEMNRSGDAAGSTRDRILASSLDLFGTRGVDAVSLDEIARAVGVRKQTVLYWFESKDVLVDEVLGVAAAELVIVIDAALRAAPDDPLDRIDAVVRAVFRPAVRRPALLGLIREVSRLESEPAERLRTRIQPLIDRAVAYLDVEMDAGRLRRGDPRLVAALGYATLTGIATEPEALRAVGWPTTASGLRQLRDELRAFLRAALAPG